MSLSVVQQLQICCDRILTTQRNQVEVRASSDSADTDAVCLNEVIEFLLNDVSKIRN